MNIDNEIRKLAKKSNFTARSKTVSESIGGNPVKKWWFTDENNNLVSSESGMTDIETLQWLAGENIEEIHLIRQLLKEIDEDED